MIILRDNMKSDLKQMAQRDHYFAIVDEVDSILIDEARTLQIECTIMYLPFNISETLRMRFDEDAGFLKS